MEVAFLKVSWDELERFEAQEYKRKVCRVDRGYTPHPLRSGLRLGWFWPSASCSMMSVGRSSGKSTLVFIFSWTSQRQTVHQLQTWCVMRCFPGILLKVVIMWRVTATGLHPVFRLWDDAADSSTYSRSSNTLGNTVSLTWKKIVYINI